MSNFLKRDIQALIDDYLKIIPDNEKTKCYRGKLRELSLIISKQLLYAAPEKISIFWDRLVNILQRYNNTFIDESWAKAIYNICRYEYDNEDVNNFKYLFTHEYQKKLIIKE